MNLRVWRLRSHLSALLVLTVLASIGIVGTVRLMVRIPQIEREHRGVVADDVAELTSRVETLLGLLTARLDLLSDALQVLPLSQANELMDRATGGRQAFGAIYLATNQGTVVAAGVAPELRLHRDDLLGSDLSANPLHRAALSSRRIAWGDHGGRGLPGGGKPYFDRRGATDLPAGRGATGGRYPSIHHLAGGPRGGNFGGHRRGAAGGHGEPAEFAGDAGGRQRAALAGRGHF